MPKLIIQRDQTGAAGRDIIDFDDGMSATDILMREFPDGINPDGALIFVNSKKTTYPDRSLIKPLFHNETVLIIQEVKGIELIAAIVVAAIVAVALAPSIPGDVGAKKESPNNTLQGQTNIARPYQAYPLIFGSPRAYPDLGAESLSQYINNQKIVKQFMCVGVGTFDIEEIRAGETPVSNFEGASTNVIEPVNRVATVPQLTVPFATNEVDGQELLGTNEGILGSEYTVVENQSPTYIGSTFTAIIDKDTQSDALKTAFDASTTNFNVEVNYILGTETISAKGAGTITSMVLDGTNTFYTVVISDFTGPTDYLDAYAGPSKITETQGLLIGPIKMQTESDELWVDIIFQRGLKGVASFEMITQELDGPSGTPIPATEQTFNWSYTEDTLDEQFRTYKATLASKGYYQFEIRRDNESNQSASNPDQAKLEAVNSISFYDNLTFGNVTLLEVEVPATISATSLRENKINLSLTSRLLTYDGVSVSTTPSASRKFADALLHLHVDFYGLDANTLALDELYEIQNRLDAIDPRLATFDFTFDDIDVGYEERADAILQVARCFKWLDGDVYRFARDEERLFESAIIGRRDLSSEDDRNYSLTYNPQLLQSFDSVKVEYVDSASNKKAYIARKIDSIGNIVGGLGQHPKKIELAGCAESFNAINRAELEIRKLIYQRYTLSDTALSSGMLLDKGDMILYGEQYSTPDDFFDGEILSVSGNTAKTSESLEFDPTLTYQVHYTLTDGSVVGPFDVSEVANEPFRFSCASLSQVFVRDSELGFLIQTGSRYVITTSTELGASRWTITEKEARGDKVQLAMVNYDARIYEFD